MMYRTLYQKMYIKPINVKKWFGLNSIHKSKSIVGKFIDNNIQTINTHSSLKILIFLNITGKKCPVRINLYKRKMKFSCQNDVKFK